MGMKFDVVLGNPPYNAHSKMVAVLWPKFINAALDCEPEHLLMVVPISLLKSQSKKMQQVRGRLNKLAAEKIKGAIFPGVAADVVWFRWDGTGRQLNHRWGDVPPEHQLWVDIYQKVFTDTYKLHLTHGPGCRPCTEEPDELHKWPVQISASKLRWTIHQHPHHGLPKVFINRSGHFWHPTKAEKYVHYTEDKIAGALGCHVLVQNREEGENLISYLHSKLIVMLVQQNPMATNAFKNIPRQLAEIDVTKPWNDERVYQHHGLTAAEIEYVEKNWRGSRA